MSTLTESAPFAHCEVSGSGEHAFADAAAAATTTSIAPSTASTEPQEQPAEPPMTLDIVINNVVCSFSLHCHLNLRRIALTGCNVEYRRENGMVTMKLRKPYTTASMWSSGKITCTGATSEDMAKVAARKFARCVQKLGFHVRFGNYRVVNVLGTCAMPFAIKIMQFSSDHRANASYEPELHPGVTYKLKEPRATLKIFSTGSITVTAPSVGNVQAAIEHIFPILYEYRSNRDISAKVTGKSKRNLSQCHNNAVKKVYCHREEEEDEEDYFSNEMDSDSECSWD